MQPETDTGTTGRLQRLYRLGSVLLVATCLIWLGSAQRAAGQVPVVGLDDITTPTPTAVAPPLVILPTPTPTPNSGILGITPATADVYRVREGDTLWRVALEVGVDLDDVPCMVAPGFRPDEPLVVGQALEMLPAGWRCHRTGGNESLGEIAARYGLSPQQIVEIAWNRAGLALSAQPSAMEDASELASVRPMPGINLRIPGGTSSAVVDGLSRGGQTEAGGFLGFLLQQPVTVAPVTAYAIGGPRAATRSNVAGPVPKDWPYGSGNFMWPVFGWLTQGYRDDHRAIDIAAPLGTFVAAADRGVVVRAGWNDQGYGMFVVIDHNIDYVTLYSHLRDIFVREGEVVAQGQIIGTVGSTGNSTGPHLHFEIRDFGRRTNPLGLLVR